MKVCVFGGAGFIGSHLVERLVKDNHEVLVVDDLSSGFFNYLPKGIKFLKLDISNWSELSKNFSHFKNIETVFLLAAKSRIQPSIYEPSRTHDVNVTGTMNILEMMRMMNIRRIVYSASSSAYGLKNPSPLKENMPVDCLNPYALTKYVAEQYCKTWGKIYGIENVCLKYFNVYGKRSPLQDSSYAPVIGLFFRQALQDKKALTIVGDGKQRRDFTHINDVVEANILAMQSDNPDINGETFNIGTGSNYSIDDIADKVIEKLCDNGIRADKVYIPPRPGEAQETLADNSKARLLLKWAPRWSLDDGLDELTPYYIELLTAATSIDPGFFVKYS